MTENHQRDESESIDLSPTAFFDSSTEEDTSLTPEAVGRYGIVKPIGRGGFGIVYLAFDELLDRNVVVKVPHSSLISDLRTARDYISEARIVANLEHPNIVPVYDVGSTGEYPCFIVMKYIKGTDLRRRIAESSFNVLQTAELISVLAAALHHGHKQGIVHRDIKPGNILIDERETPFVVDFGLALRDQDVDASSRYAGTAIYMSPEQARGEGHRVDGRSDIYSLGAVFYELLTGRKTVSGSTKWEILDQVRSQEVKPPRQINDAVPRELERICLKALAKRASERYTTALDMADELRDFLSSALGIISHSTSPLATVLAGRESQNGISVWQASSAIKTSSDSQSINIVPKGLRSFESHDADFFLKLLPGPRDREGLPESVRFWKNRLEEFDAERTFPVGVIYGPSGCGKSSLVKAGLLPRLSSDVISLFVEATAANTEADMKRLLRSRWFHDQEGRGLAQMLAALRRGEGPSAGRKILFVLDQFEQWLHAASDYDRSELCEALRQCDGERLQCVLLVRDDFWLPVSRFMRALEIRLVEGHNSALVDLFDRDHAKRVLAEFGRAYEKLPTSKQMTQDHWKFLEQAVQTVSHDGKVICVQLALFVEMMKDRTWVAGSLDAIGGATGIGVAFLDQTFSSSTAPPEHRLHQNAACAVLKALLPNVGVDIKGEMKSYDTLRNASGYVDRKDFDELIRILDNDLRLIAPTDPHSADVESGISQSDRSHAETKAEFFQLTHDFLVQPLREWLTRKQKTTARGRAELRLAERTSLWKGSRESRLLPAWWEWLNIRAFTDAKNWTGGQQQMMRQMDRRLALRALVIAACLLLILGLGWEINGRRRARSLTETLTHAPTREVPAIVNNMVDYRRWIVPDLRAALASKTFRENDPQELHLRLALLPVEREQLEWLTDRILVSTPEELAAIRECLSPHAAEVAPRLWNVFKDDRPLAYKLRAACFLAVHEPNDPRWAGASNEVIAALMSENSLVVKEWVALLDTAGPILLPAIAKSIAECKQSAELRKLADVYAVFAGSGGFQPLKGVLNAPGPKGTSQRQLARRHSNAATALAIAGRWDDVWPLLRRTQDPTTRTRLISQLGSNNIISEELVQHLEPGSEPDPSIRQAFVLVLGDLSDDHWSMSERKRLLSRLEQLQITEEDPGVQSAIRWTLKSWENTDGGQRENSASLAEFDMVVVEPGQIEIQDRDGTTRRLKLSRRIAVSRTEVTVGEFRRFRTDQMWDRRAAPTADCPVHEVTWFDAVAYCNWLSQEANLPRDQWCYATNENGDYASGMVIEADALDRSGFRLPTSEEWEYACRAGTVTDWSIGDCVDLLDRYGWSMENSGFHSHPVGRLRPNDLGLFDMHGNVWEWCHDRVTEAGDPISDRENRRVYDDHLFAMRGGTFLADRGSLGSGTLNWNRADKHTNADGFRVVRSVLK